MMKIFRTFCSFSVAILAGALLFHGIHGWGTIAGAVAILLHAPELFVE